jgi:ribosome-associated toxin RatA of RatAB toxin-antitoxin module
VAVAQVSRSALVPYSADAMFFLVNDVASYPQFMDGCQSVKIIEHTEQRMVASLCLKKAGIEVNLTTENKLIPGECIEMSLQDGPFSSFKGLWQFKALSDSASRLSLDLEFEFKRRGLGTVASGMFSGVANNLVDALCRRADEMYK